VSILLLLQVLDQAAGSGAREERRATLPHRFEHWWLVRSQKPKKLATTFYEFEMLLPPDFIW
jgi:hypothetical protein